MKGVTETLIIPEEIRDKTKFCFECGICTASCPMVELLPADYNPRSLLQRVLTAPREALEENMLWLCAWCYRCYKMCPQGVKPPEIFQRFKSEAAKRGVLSGFQEAISLIEKELPFPLVCWHTCFHPERAIDDDRVKGVYEELVSRGSTREVLKSPACKETIAIIGSGPAGLTAAFELAKMGYRATIFEALPYAGGVLRKSMPDFRLPKRVLESEIALLKELGVEIKTNVKVGKDVSFDDLRVNGYDSIFVAIGAHRGKKLGVRGESLAGVIDALDFLWKAKSQKKVDLGEKVGVIGGGNVAVDAARMALCQGVEESIIFYRRSREEMPANLWEIMEAEKEGVQLNFLTSPVEILGTGGKVAGLKFLKMKLGELDETGRRTPIPIEDSEYSVQLDAVIIAIGETSEVDFLPEEVEVDRGNRILVNPITMETSVAGVFAGGDSVTGSATVIEAILAGKRAAYSINQYLTEIKMKRRRGDA